MESLHVSGVGVELDCDFFVVSISVVQREGLVLEC